MIPQTRARFSYQAWRRSDAPTGEAYPLDTGATTLAEAIADTAPSCHFKDTLLVLEADAVSRKQVLHAFVIKRKTQAIYRRNPDTMLTERVQPLYAAPLFSVAVAEFAPVEPWRWSLGADVVGVDRTLIVDVA